MKLLESSKAVILLRKKSQKGDISYKDNLEPIQGSDSIFMAYNLNNFRSKFNMLRAEAERVDCNLFLIFLSNGQPFWFFLVFSSSMLC